MTLKDLNEVSGPFPIVWMSPEEVDALTDEILKEPRDISDKAQDVFAAAVKIFAEELWKIEPTPFSKPIPEVESTHNCLEQDDAAPALIRRYADRLAERLSS